jgi:hypothetical protein
MGTAYYGTGPGELTADPSLQGITKSFGGGEAYNFNSGNLAKGSGMGPAAIIAGVGAIAQGVGGAISANTQAKAAKEIARWQIEAENARNYQAYLAGNEANTYGKQFEMNLQRNAADYQQGFLDPRKSILGAEDYTRRAAAELSPFGQKLAQQAQSAGIQNTLAGKYNGMFGQINQNPFMFGQKPGYTTSSFV